MTIAILHGPQRSGKTLHSQSIKNLYKCKRIVDEWDGVQPLEDGDLAITNHEPPFNIPGAFTVDIRAITPGLDYCHAINERMRKYQEEMKHIRGVLGDDGNVQVSGAYHILFESESIPLTTRDRVENFLFSLLRDAAVICDVLDIPREKHLRNLPENEVENGEEYTVVKRCDIRRLSKTQLTELQCQVLTKLAIVCDLKDIPYCEWSGIGGGKKYYNVRMKQTERR